jgi:hypothetical protein
VTVGEDALFGSHLKVLESNTSILLVETKVVFEVLVVFVVVRSAIKVELVGSSVWLLKVLVVE